jgi:hypothetical protein
MTIGDSSGSGRAYLDAVTALTEAMQQQTMQAMTRNQDAVVEVVQAWVQSAQRLTAVPSPRTLDQLPKPSEVLDRGFEIAQQLLEAQHSFARKLVEAVQQPLVDTAAQAASAGAATVTAASAGTGAGGGTGTAAGAAAAAGTEAAADEGSGLTKTIKNAIRGSSGDQE